MQLSHNVNFIHQNKMTVVSLFKAYILQTSLQMLKSLSGIGNTSANCLSWTLMCIGDIIKHFSRHLHESWMTWISSLFFSQDLEILVYLQDRESYICFLLVHYVERFSLLLSWISTKRQPLNSYLQLEICFVVVLLLPSNLRGCLANHITCFNLYMTNIFGGI